MFVPIKAGALILISSALWKIGIEAIILNANQSARSQFGQNSLVTSNRCRP